MAEDATDKPQTEQSTADGDADAVRMAEQALTDTERAAGELNAAAADGPNVDLPNFQQVLRLAEGSVVELDKLAGDPVDVYVNERLVAKGEVLVLNDNFCVRVSEIVGDTETRAAEQEKQEAEEPEDSESAEQAAATDHPT